MSRVDATDTRRQLQELTAAGFTLVYLADQTLVSHTTLRAARGGWYRHVLSPVRDAVAYAHRHLVHTDPADFGIPAGSTAVARLTAARNGWTVPTRKVTT